MDARLLVGTVVKVEEDHTREEESYLLVYADGRRVLLSSSEWLIIEEVQ